MADTKISALTAATSLTGLQLAAEQSGGNVRVPIALLGLATEYKQQPTTDVTTVSQTGLSAHKLIKLQAYLQVNASGAGVANVVVEARVSGGTYRTIATIASPSMSGASSTIPFSLNLDFSGFNESNEKIVSGVYAFGAEDAVIDSSSAANSISSTTGQVHALPSWDEVWDEIRLSGSGQFASFEGSTADQRGYVFITGF